MPKFGKAFRTFSDNIIDFQVFNLVRRNRPPHEPGRHKPPNLKPEGHDRCEQERDIQNQTTAVHDLQHLVHQFAKCADLRAAKFKHALRLTLNAQDSRRSDIININRLEFRLRTNHGQNRAKPGHARETIEEPVLLAEHDRRTQDHRVWHMRQNACFAFGLCAGVFAFAVFIRTDGGHMNHTRHIVCRSQARDAFCTVGLHGLKGVLANAVQHTDAVHHRVRTLHDRQHRGIITDVAEHRLNLSDGTVGLYEHRLIGIAHRNPNTPARFWPNAARYSAQENRIRRKW